MPRGGRDQNCLLTRRHQRPPIPQCPGGGEIKTVRPSLLHATMEYHNAPGGARSKQIPINMQKTFEIPQCPGGGEIKTRILNQHRNRPKYHNAPGGAKTKITCSGESWMRHNTTMPRGGRDQNAYRNGGAFRSSIPQCPGGGRDQNFPHWCIALSNQIPQCPGGGEIKTIFGMRSHAAG